MLGRTLTFFTIFTILPFSVPAQAADYFPLQPGNQWIYRSSQPFRSTWIVEVTGQRIVAGHEYFEVRGLSGVTLLRKNDAGTLVFYDLGEQREKNWVAFGAPVGEAFPTEVDPCNRSAVIRSHAAKLRGPLGEFDNGLEVAYPISGCADAGLTREVFLPFVGLVERRQSNIAGEQVFSLIYARLGGYTVFSEKEHSFGVTLDSSSYQRGDTITARLTLRNTQPEPLQLTFPSGQDYDLVIRDASGAVVYRWSDGRAFVQIFRMIPVQGERLWLILVPIGAGGPALRPGNYTLTANLAVNEIKLEASVPIVVRE
jgi:hypothetical protein